VFILALGVMLPPGLWRAMASGGHAGCGMSCCAGGTCRMCLCGSRCPMKHDSRHAAHGVTCTCAVHSSGSSALPAGPSEFRFAPSRAEAVPQPAVAIFRMAHEFTPALAGYPHPL